MECQPSALAWPLWAGTGLQPWDHLSFHTGNSLSFLTPFFFILSVFVHLV